MTEREEEDRDAILIRKVKNPNNNCPYVSLLGGCNVVKTCVCGLIGDEYITAKCPYYAHPVFVEIGAEVQYANLMYVREGFPKDPPPTRLGDFTRVRKGAVIYVGCEIGVYCHIAHNAVIREYTKIGDYTSIGTAVVIEGYTWIGNHVNIHSQAHITAKARIDDYVFIAPLAGCVNGAVVSWQRPWIKRVEKGAWIKRGAILGFGAKVLPGVTIGKNAIVGAQSLVTKDIPDNKVVMGVPARIVKDTPEKYIIPEDYDPMEYYKVTENTKRR